MPLLLIFLFSLSYRKLVSNLSSMNLFLGAMISLCTVQRKSLAEVLSYFNVFLQTVNQEGEILFFHLLTLFI